MVIKLSKNELKRQDDFRAFIFQYLLPYVDEYEQSGCFPKEFIATLRTKGYFGSVIPKEHDGLGFDNITLGLLCEEFGKGNLSLVSLITVHSMVAHSVLKWGNNNQIKYWLPKFASGEILAAFALSEPNIGSDPVNMETTAKKSDAHYILNGKKKWISGAQIADVFLVYAKCEKGITAFIVDRDTAGFSCKSISGMLGFRSAMLGEILLDNCKVPERNLIGKEGMGFRYVANTALDLGRFMIAWGCVGLGQACLDSSLDYTNQRKQGGVLLRKHQIIQSMIANMATEIKAARLLCFNVAYLKEINNSNSLIETNIAKYYASKMANKVAADAVQLHGANGCSSEYPVQRYLRDAKITEIIEGSSQIQQLLISQYAYQNYIYKSRTREIRTKKNEQ